MDRRSAWVRVRRAVTGTDDARDGGVVLRMAFVTGMVLAGFVWVTGQAGWYQFDEEGVREARDLSAMTGSEEVQGRRGEIRDRTGRRVLAMTVPDPEVVYFGASWDVDRIELSYTLASALHLDPGEVLSSVVSAVEFARMMGRQPRTVYDWVENGTLAEFGIPICQFRHGKSHSGRVFIQNIY